MTQAEEARLTLSERLDDCRRLRRLIRFVLNQVANDDVGIESDHDAAVVAPVAMASSMS